MIYKVDLFHDEAMKRYAQTKFVEAQSKENIDMSKEWFDGYTIEEDVELEQPAIFYAAITHNYSDGYDCDHKDYVKTIYVQATSYKDGTEKLKNKFKQQYETYDDYYLNRVYKDDRDPLTILLSK